jgi:hypothetical protein
MSRLCIYIKKEPAKKRWFEGDQHLRKLIRQLIKGPDRISSVEKVFNGLCRGFDKLNVPYFINLPFDQLNPEDKVIVLGIGRNSLIGYQKPNKIIAGIGLMNHPNEWINLPIEYPVAKYLQHSHWTNNIYKKYYGDICDIWFAGIDTEKWTPACQQKKIDVLVYDKIMWNRPIKTETLLNPIISYLYSQGLCISIIKYGAYTEDQYFEMLNNSKCMIFLCEHESQGIACEEALAMNVPVFAWNQGFWLDPHRIAWDDPIVAASSVPYFDQSCGATFNDLEDFVKSFDHFFRLVNQNAFQPRKYVVDHISIEKSTERMLQIVNEVYP